MELLNLINFKLVVKTYGTFSCRSSLRYT